MNTQTQYHPNNPFVTTKNPSSTATNPFSTEVQNQKTQISELKGRLTASEDVVEELEGKNKMLINRMAINYPNRKAVGVAVATMAFNMAVLGMPLYMNALSLTPVAMMALVKFAADRMNLSPEGQAKAKTIQKLSIFTAPIAMVIASTVGGLGTAAYAVGEVTISKNPFETIFMLAAMAFIPFFALLGGMIASIKMLITSLLVYAVADK